MWVITVEQHHHRLFKSCPEDEEEERKDWVFCFEGDKYLMPWRGRVCLRCQAVCVTALLATGCRVWCNRCQKWHQHLHALSQDLAMTKGQPDTPATCFQWKLFLTLSLPKYLHCWCSSYWSLAPKTVAVPSLSRTTRIQIQDFWLAGMFSIVHTLMYIHCTSFLHLLFFIWVETSCCCF